MCLGISYLSIIPRTVSAQHVLVSDLFRFRMKRLQATWSIGRARAPMAMPAAVCRALLTSSLQGGFAYGGHGYVRPNRDGLLPTMDSLKERVGFHTLVLLKDCQRLGFDARPFYADGTILELSKLSRASCSRHPSQIRVL